LRGRGLDLAPNAAEDTTTSSYLGQSECGYQRGETDANGHSQEETGLYEASLFVFEHPPVAGQIEVDGFARR